MTDLRNTIAHIIEHKQHLAGINEATTQQYVILPILRTLGWNDANLASMEIIPEYQVESRRADYALHIKQKQNPVVFIECKRWDQPIGKNEEQICFYAYSGNVPLAIITNGKLWRFYLSRWEASSLSDRVFCEIDIENREAAISNLEKYLLKSNVASGEAELNAEIALEEKRKTSTSEISPTLPNPDPVDVTDTPSEKRPVTVLPELDVKWTIDMVRNSLSSEFTVHYEKTHSEERCKLFYTRLAELLNLIKKEGWELQQIPSKIACNFWLEGKDRKKKQRVFGLRITFNPPRLRVKITEEEAEKLSMQHGCQVAWYDGNNAYY